MSTPLIRDLTLLRDADLNAVQQVLTQAWRQWAEAWGLALPADAVLVASGTDLASTDDTDLVALDWQAGPASATWTHVPAAWRTRLAAELVGRSSKAPMPEDDLSLVVADRALADLRQRWREALPVPEGQGPQASLAQAWLPLSGAVLLTDAGSGLRCLLNRAACRALLPQAKVPAPTTPPAGLLGVLARHRLPVTLGLGEVEIPVSDLLGLQTGDVIQFPIRLSDELPLTVAADVQPAPALTCQLGQLEGRLAIKVVAKAQTA